MAITIGDLLDFNDVETTDILQGIIELPYVKPIAYVPGRTYSTEFEDIVKGLGQRGSQAIIRKLGKGTVKSVKVTAANALDFSHQETADDIEVIPIDDVISKSEKIYEAVDLARVSATGARKAEVVLTQVIEESQRLMSKYLVSSVPAVANAVALTPTNVYEKILAAYGLLDETPTTIAVNKATYNLLLSLVTTGYFIANSREDAIRTGILGNILGMDVVRDDHLTVDFVIYNFNNFPVFTLMNTFDIVDAKPDFIGAYALAQGIQGGGRTPLTLDDEGLWGVSYKVAGEDDDDEGGDDDEGEGEEE